MRDPLCTARALAKVVVSNAAECRCKAAVDLVGKLRGNQEDHAYPHCMRRVCFNTVLDIELRAFNCASRDLFDFIAVGTVVVR